MGEEYDISNTKFIIGERTFEFSQVESVEIVSDTEEATNEVFASMKPTDEIEFSCSWTMSKKAYFMLMVGTNRRMIRRALRWYEKLRRKGFSKEDALYKASYKARFAGNNKKPKRCKFYGYTISFNPLNIDITG